MIPLPDDTDRTAPNELSVRTLSGVAWTYATTVAGVVVQTVFTAVISRLLDDSTFGVIAVAQLSLRFGAYLSELGLGKALIQRAHLDEDDVRTGFTAGTILGVVVAGVFVSAAPAIGQLFNDPAIVRPLQAMSASMVLFGAGMTATALANRQMRFRELGVISLVSYVVGYLGVGLVLAWLGAGVWSLVAATLVQTGLDGILTYAVVRHRVRPLLARPALRRLYSYGGRVGVLGLLEFIGGDLDTFAIGRYGGTQVLGQYNRAYMLIKLPLYYVLTSVTAVAFPGMSTMQRDIPRLRSAYVSLAGIIAALLLPICAGAAVAAPELSLVVLGPQWATTADVLPVICAAVAIQFLTTPCGIVLEAMAELNKKLVVQTVYLVLLGALMLLVADGPDVGYAVALAAGGLLRHVMYVGVLRQVLSLDVGDLARRYLHASLVAALVAGAVALVRSGSFGLGAPPPAVLFAQMGTGALVALVCTRVGLFGPIVHDLIVRLHAAGATGGDARVGRVLCAVFGARALTRHSPDR